MLYVYHFMPKLSIFEPSDHPRGYQDVNGNAVVELADPAPGSYVVVLLMS